MALSCPDTLLFTLIEAAHKTDHGGTAGAGSVPAVPTAHLQQGCAGCGRVSSSSHCCSSFPKKSTSGLVCFFQGEKYS